MLPEEERFAIAKWRIEKARTNVEAAKVLLDSKMFAESANRSYYAVFHAMNSLSALEGVTYKKHSGVLSHFNRCYIKTEVTIQNPHQNQRKSIGFVLLAN